jgi:hypothetical protein
VRASNKQISFDVISRKSVVAFRIPLRCIGFVQTYYEKPPQRLWEVMKSPKECKKTSRWCSCSTAAKTCGGCKTACTPNGEYIIG